MSFGRNARIGYDRRHAGKRILGRRLADPSAMKDASYTFPMDPAMMSRFSILPVERSVKTWIPWAIKASVHPVVLDIVQNDPKVFLLPSNNPRSLKKVSDLLTKFEPSMGDPKLLRWLINGYVGDKLGSAIFSMYMRSDNFAIPTPDQILKSYPKYQKQILQWKAKGDTSILDSLTHQMLIFTQDPQNAGIVSAKNCSENFRQFRADMPAEFKKKLDKFMRPMGPGGGKHVGP